MRKITNTYAFRGKPGLLDEFKEEWFAAEETEIGLLKSAFIDIVKLNAELWKKAASKMTAEEQQKFLNTHKKGFKVLRGMPRE